MNYFGCRDDFAIEVGSELDFGGQCRLGFYAFGIHLNRADTWGNLGIAFYGWPTGLFSTDHWSATDIYWEMPFSSSAEQLLERVLADHEMHHRHLTFQLGPVTDSFSMLVFGRPTDFVLLLIRNDHFQDDDDDLPQWNHMVHDGTESIHWLSLTMPRGEFKDICTRAHACVGTLMPAA